MEQWSITSGYRGSTCLSDDESQHGARALTDAA